VLDGILRDVADLYNPDGPERVDEQGVRAVGPRVQEAWRVSENVKALALSPKILTVLEELYGRKPLPLQTLNFRVGTQQLAHSDAFHFNSVPAGFMCGVWVALEDIDMDNGPLMYYRGSHKLKEATWHDVGIVRREPFDSDREYLNERRTAYERYVQKVIAENGYEEPEYVSGPKGMVLIWSSNLLHGGAPQRDPNRTRHSQVTHYFFEGVRTFNPMLEVPGERKFWTYPMWISADRPREITPDYIREVIESNTEEGSIVLVASRGKEKLLELQGREGWHFPRSEDGSPAKRPGSSEAATAQLEELREKGARYLAWPAWTIRWLIEDYSQFGEYLEERYTSILRDKGSCVIFDLAGK
jgi:Phytanoyl-CoA dioxygenase (PhyH)